MFYRHLPPCPCNELFARLDPNYRPAYATPYQRCYRSRFKISIRMQVSYFGLHYIWTTVHFFRVSPEMEITFKKHYCALLNGIYYCLFQFCCFKVGPMRRIPALGNVPIGPLITWPQGNYHPGTVRVFGLPQGDQEGYQYCCIDSTQFCSAYYTMRSVDFCYGYKPPKQGNSYMNIYE